MFEIKKLADGFAIYKDGVYVMWCHTEEWAKKRLEEMQ